MFRLAARRTVPRIELRGGVRPQSTALLFYQNRQLESYASRETKRLTLRQLVYEFPDFTHFHLLDVSAGILWAFDE